MGRRHIALALAVASLAPASARADHVCLSSFTWDAGESVELGPFFSSDGEALTSAPASTALAGRAHAPSRPADSLYCVSSDDPRCMPRNGAPDAPPQLAANAFHGALTLPSFRLDPSPSRSLRWWRLADAARPGVSTRVERPPRA